MSLFPPIDDNATYFSMFDNESDWSRTSEKPFLLDDRLWKTAEHYFQAMQFENQDDQSRICDAETVDTAIKLGKRWFKPKRKNWKNLRTTYMTRALYTQCQVYPEMARALLNTNKEVLVENSQFDYFWGCGRDRRGENQYGKILMNIRIKLHEKTHD